MNDFSTEHNLSTRKSFGVAQSLRKMLGHRDILASGFKDSRTEQNKLLDDLFEVVK